MAPTLFRCLLISALAVFLGSNGVVSQGAIRSLHVSTEIVYRFATTSVRSVMVNTRQETDDITFIYHLPKESLVANFTTTVDGVTYSGRLEGFESRRLYRPVSGQEAEEARVRGTNTFKFSIRLAARKEVTFELIYYEFLSRRAGTHSHVVYLDPGQIVPELKISTDIIESRALTSLNVPPLQGFAMDATPNEVVSQLANLQWRAPNAVQITYEPTPQDQREASPSGLSGKFMINYDVSRTSDAGQLQVVNGYFVHYFAPAGYRSIPRRMVFVLDISGSMKGEKIAQVRAALRSMINDLQDEDMFNIIVFSSGVTRWQRSLVAATADNKGAALRWFSQDVRVEGLTNINGALTTALHDLQTFRQRSASDQGTPYILFLTDGDPTAGETDVATILQNIRSRNTLQTSIYSIGFGDEIKIPFLQRISIQNGGFARKIYASSDAALQLQGFFREISSPLLSDVKVTYTGNMVDERTVTRTDYNLFFNGSEIFITGRLRVPTTTGITASVQANARYGPLTLSKQSSSAMQGLEAPSAAVLEQSVERMWAYSIIKDTVREAFESDSKVERVTLRRRTRDLSLRYNILSPATVLVASKPESAGEIIDIIQADSPREDADDSQGQGPAVDPPTHPKQNIPQPEHPQPKHPQPEHHPDRPKHPQPHHPSEPDRETPRHNEAVPKPKEGEESPRIPAGERHSRKPHPESPGHKSDDRLKVPDKPVTGKPDMGIDCDPHVIIDVRNKPNEYVCYDIFGDPENIYQILDDPVNLISVRGMVIAKNYKNGRDSKHKATYLGQVGIKYGNVEIFIFPEAFEVEGNTYQWEVGQQHTGNNYELIVNPENRLQITIGDDIWFMVLRHYRRNDDQVLKTPYLGFYLIDIRGLSAECGGMLGEFLTMEIATDIPWAQALQQNMTATLERLDIPLVKDLEVHANHRLNLALDKRVRCWHVWNSGRGLLQFPLHDYLRDDLV